VLAVERGEAPHLPRGLGEFRQDPHLVHFPQVRVVQFDHHLPVNHLRVAEDLPDVVDLPDGDVLRREQVEPLVPGLRQEHLLQAGSDREELLVGRLKGHVHGPFGRHEFLLADCPAQVVPEMGLEAADAEVFPVPGPVDAVVRIAPHGPGLPALHDRTVHEEPVGEPGDQMNGPLHVGVIDILPLAGLPPGHEGQENPDGPVEGDTGEVGDDVERNGGRTVLRTNEAQNPRQGDIVDVMAREKAVGSVLPVSGKGAVDDPRVDPADRPVVDPEPLHDAGPVALDDHIGALRHPVKDPPPLVGPEIQADAPLVAVEREKGGLPFPVLSARRVPHVCHREGLRRFHLDDVGTEVGQDHGTQRTGDVIRQIEDLDSIQRHHRSLPPFVERRPGAHHGQAGKARRRGGGTLDKPAAEFPRPVSPTFWTRRLYITDRHVPPQKPPHGVSRA